MSERKAYPSDVSDDEWAFVAPYLTLMTEDVPQREYPLREVLNGLRYVVRGGIPWRMLPNDLPPWHTVYQQTQRWLKAGVFEAMVHDLREVLRLPRRWVVERSFGWAARFRRLARDYERLPETLKGLHFLAFALLMAHRFVQLMAYVL